MLKSMMAWPFIYESVVWLDTVSAEILEKYSGIN